MRRQPIPNAHSAGRQAGLAMQGYAPAQAFAPSTFGFGGASLGSVADTFYLARIRNVIDGDDVLGFIFSWNAVINQTTTVRHKINLVTFDASSQVFRTVLSAYKDTELDFAEGTTWTLTELLQVPVTRLDEQRTLAVAVQCERTSGHFATQPRMFGIHLQDSASAGIIVSETGVALSPGTSTEIPNIIDPRQSTHQQFCPGVGLATSRAKVVGQFSESAFLF